MVEQQDKLSNLDRTDDKMLKQFFKHFKQQDPEQCWNWSGPKQLGVGKLPYGRFHYNYRFYIASRVSWLVHNGIIPENLCVLHRCDNPSCVNPSHLFLGTKLDNVIDMVEKGRQSKGMRHGAAVGRKYSPEIIAAVRASTDSYSMLRKRYGMSLSQIHRLKHGKRLQHSFQPEKVGFSEYQQKHF